MDYFNEKISSKITWEGKVLSIQPRARVWRYLVHNRTHYLLGYNFFIEGFSSNGLENFTVAISEKQQLNSEFRVGDIIKGTAWTKKYEKREFADYYRAGALKLLNREKDEIIIFPPPWIIKPPSMNVYEDRGARILSKNQWKSKCFQCIWANMSNVEIQWDFDKDIKKYRFESFCYGPKSCKYYKMGRARSVSHKNMGSVLDDGFLDDICTENRDEDE
ncbi:hypothetical protein RBH29_15045 [Herbivorax sp. ANBcel31]|uniref:hypothetical protein n=1 Tax=Herbivorax sp. ANBcel31 TaxID=3069754 RepID=UPI0027B823B0|nr:hypothetical protein [Herbivorax sp. ANBcel31]MDQ2087745.1 hypothetical protein [Herbivorax sp. ANBcel31]